MSPSLTPRPATVADIDRLLRFNPRAVLDKLKLRDATVGMPTDGNAPRLQLSVDPEDLPNVPRTVVLLIDGDAVEFSLEGLPTYHRFHAL